jgi:hypothetical protein
MYRIVLLPVLALVALMAFGQTAIAQGTTTHEGIIVSADSNKLVMTDKEGKNEHSHNLDLTTKVTLDGKPAKLADLKKGQFVKVTTRKEGDKQFVVAIDAMTKKP